MDSTFETEFLGMTSEPIALRVLLETRETLIMKIHSSLTQNEKDFLISFKRGEPNWSLLAANGVESLPAVQWKLRNIKIMNDERKYLMVSKLEKVLG